VSDPSDPLYGKHWSLEEVAALTAPRDTSARLCQWLSGDSEDIPSLRSLEDEEREGAHPCHHRHHLNVTKGHQTYIWPLHHIKIILKMKDDDHDEIHDFRSS